MLLLLFLYYWGGGGVVKGPVNPVFIMLNHPSPKMLHKLNDRAFKTAALKLWHNLPRFIGNQQSLNITLSSTII